MFYLGRRAFLLSLFILSFIGISLSGITSEVAVSQTLSITVDTVLGDGFTYPVGVYHAGDGSGRLFVVEQTGKIKIIKDNKVLATPFLNLESKIVSGGERGLLGLAFHPKFKSNGVLYVNYTRQPDGATVISRFMVSSNPDVVDLVSESVLLSIGQPFANHNGGHIAFGLDGYLYIGMGDGGSAGDPNNYALSLNSLLGKMLRIDVDKTSQGRNYAIPPGNINQEIWALGLRNPWFWSFDRLNGDLYIGDVGQNRWEEVNFYAFTSPPGPNFGWSCLEGNHDFNLKRFPCTNASYVANTIKPIVEYGHNEGQSITGGYVYRGKLYPELFGRYFYADFSTGKIWSLYQTGIDPVRFSNPLLHLVADFLISCFGEDENGEITICDYYGGKVRNLQHASGAQPNMANSTLRADPLYANQDEIVTYTLTLINSGGMYGNFITAKIHMPEGLIYLGSSNPIDDSNAPELIWRGILPPNQTEVITYTVQVGIPQGNPLTSVELSGEGLTPTTLRHVLFIPKSALETTMRDFFFPGTQPGEIVDPILLPATCDVCHTSLITNAWQGSMMSQAGRDPLFWAALEVANHDVPGSGEYCMRCHLPKAWLEGRSSTPDGSALMPADFDSGVTCEICHRAVDPVASTNPEDQARIRDTSIRSGLGLPLPEGHIGSAMMIIDPADYRRGPFDLGDNFNYHPNQTYRSDFLGGDPNNPIARSRLCGNCHNVDNPILSWDNTEMDYLPNNVNEGAPSFEQGDLFAVETTFDEWLNSDYAMTTACQDCHMPRTTGYAAESFLGSVFRDCDINGCLPVHEFVGGNTWIPQLLQNPLWRLNRQDLRSLLNNTILKSRAMLQQAAKVDVDFQETNNLTVVRITNLTGHKLPTGYTQGRRMWVRIVAYNDNGDEVFSACQYDPLTGILIDDANCIVFEALQAITPKFAAMLNPQVQAGPSFHFMLNNSVYKDNRIPPAGFTVQALNRRGLMPMQNGVPSQIYAPNQNYFEAIFNLPPEATSVVAFLFYQTASKEYIDFLVAKGGVDAQLLAQLWEGNKSPPELVAWGSDPFFEKYLPTVYR
jgi:glucose/arabinose dehydrogenase